MWVFLNNAFLSIVEDKDDPSMLMVRARLRGDIQRTFSFPGLQVTETPPPADYRFRTRVERWRVSDVLSVAVHDIDYTNFKNSVPDKPRHDAYLRVWSAMAREQEDRLHIESRRVVCKNDECEDGFVPDAKACWKPCPDCAVPNKKPVNPRGKKGSRPRS